MAANDELWLVWVWRHHSLEVEEFGSKDTALGFAQEVEDRGSGAVEAIEGPNGPLSARYVNEWYDEFDRKQMEALAVIVERPKPTHYLKAQSPDGTWVTAFTTSSIDELQAEVEKYQRTLPPDRIETGAYPA